MSLASTRCGIPQANRSLWLCQDEARRVLVAFCVLVTLRPIVETLLLVTFVGRLSVLLMAFGSVFSLLLVSGGALVVGFFVLVGHGNPETIQQGIGDQAATRLTELLEPRDH
jgi:hypothetical protein